LAALERRLEAPCIEGWWCWTLAEEEAIFNYAFQDCRPWKFVYHGHDDGERVRIDPGGLDAHIRRPLTVSASAPAFAFRR
jgi:hypothetical protein